MIKTLKTKTIKVEYINRFECTTYKFVDPKEIKDPSNKVETYKTNSSKLNGAINEIADDLELLYKVVLNWD